MVSVKYYNKSLGQSLEKFMCVININTVTVRNNNMRIRYRILHIYWKKIKEAMHPK